MALTVDQKNFIESIARYVKKYASRYGFKSHSAIIAQAILESRWGKSKLSAVYHNYFGMKCGSRWTGHSVNMDTMEEYQEGVKTPINDNFRVYASMEEGVKGYFEFLTALSRYDNLRGISDPREYLETIKTDGYATSSNYVEEVYKCVVAYNLTQYDTAKDYLRNAVVSIMQGWVGKKKSNGSYKEIIDIYNSITPRPRGYKVKYSDKWCAATVSAAFHQAGYDEIFPTECSCYYMIENAKRMGIWKESDEYVPDPADCILYDWQDKGSGDNQGNPDHVGMVEKVSNGVITVIEGNYNDSVKRRTLAVNSRYIRGYVVPKFTVDETSGTNLNRIPKWNGRTTTTLRVRTWAGVEYDKCSFSPLEKDTVVGVCDSVKASDGSMWYYIKYSGKYGFCHSEYIEKQS